MNEIIVPEEAEIIQMIFDIYVNENWGTKKKEEIYHPSFLIPLINEVLIPKK
ncbi:hypothetical protein BGM26_18580 [Bacillus sp. FJAT-29790]|uniref:hypothetical protein n=1 Tax=Bacillus sp. FJAT-29790 TaxID=1895002 RepID=UPI001C248151|nr:hypothetical protein [Bacillus sp. FJAT-29790]MBU8880958.1 hypothetical protein [Bacillus sp. FJAT-29790]